MQQVRKWCITNVHVAELFVRQNGRSLSYYTILVRQDHQADGLPVMVIVTVVVEEDIVVAAAVVAVAQAEDGNA